MCRLIQIARKCKAYCMSLKLFAFYFVYRNSEDTSDTESYRPFNKKKSKSGPTCKQQEKSTLFLFIFVVLYYVQVMKVSY